MTQLHFHRLFAALPSPFMVLDEDLRYVAVNEAYEQAVGKRAVEMAGRFIFDVFPDPGEGGRRLEASLRRVLRTGHSDTIAYIPYLMPRPASQGGGAEMRYWTATHIPLADESGRTAFIVQNTVDVTELAVGGNEPAAGADTTRKGIEVLQRAREAEEAYQASLAESEEFKRLFHQAPGMIAILRGPDHVFTFANEAYHKFVGARPLIGLPIRKALPEIAEQGYPDLLDHVFRTGEAQHGEGVRVSLFGEAGSAPVETFLDFSYQPVRDAAGRIAGVFVQGSDRTEQHRAAERQRLMLDELNHRVKNTLSTVQSIARQSFRSSADAGARGAFEARIKALSAAHDVISEGLWQHASLAVLLTRELAPFEASRCRISGPTVSVMPRAAIALALVFHELASNAAKYGTLAREDGSIDIGWEWLGEPGEDHMALTWREVGNRSLPAAWKRGFGIRALERMVEGELGGRLSMGRQGDDLVCRIELARRDVEDVRG